MAQKRRVAVTPNLFPRRPVTTGLSLCSFFFHHRKSSWQLEREAALEEGPLSIGVYKHLVRHVLFFPPFPSLLVLLILLPRFITLSRPLRRLKGPYWAVVVVLMAM